VVHLKRKRILALLLSLALALGAPGVSVLAAEDEECTVIGADLTNAQTEEVYALFGLERGSVRELSMTNAEERLWLEGYVDDALIGTSSISCVYIRLLPEGSGTEVTVHNVTWCTEEMYRAALETAGITDVRAIIASPFEVSGTAALAGIYKAYETLTGKALDNVAKQLGVQELITTAGLADQLGQLDAETIVDEVKKVLVETADMTDEELGEQIRSIAAGYHINLTDYQVRQLIMLCRQMEKLSDLELKEKIQALQEKAKQLNEMNEKAQEAKDTLAAVAESVKGFLVKVGDFFAGLFGKK
jgi:uncharacterized protein YpuA (DUF1002 family)